MASRTFAINQTPHEAIVGDVTFLFTPEVNGAEFAEAYSELKEAQKQVSAAGDNIGGSELRAVHQAMCDFLFRLLVPESRQVFKDTGLPDRVLVQLLEWATELYGSGSGKDQTDDPGTSSGESSAA